jgi:PAS domain S-box-containing protein
MLEFKVKEKQRQFLKITSLSTFVVSLISLIFYLFSRLDYTLETFLVIMSVSTLVVISSLCFLLTYKNLLKIASWLLLAGMLLGTNSVLFFGPRAAFPETILSYGVIPLVALINIGVFVAYGVVGLNSLLVLLATLIGKIPRSGIDDILVFAFMQVMIVWLALFLLNNLTKASEQARQNRLLLNNAQQAGNIGQFTIDLKTYESQWSDHLFKMDGYEPGEFELSGEYFNRIIHPDDLPGIQNILDDAIKTGSGVAEIRAIHKNGKILHQLITFNTLNNETGAPDIMVGTVLDITSQKIAEQKLKESEERYRAVLEQSSDAICLVELDTLKIIEANPAFQKLMGYTETELADLTLEKLYPSVQISLSQKLRESEQETDFRVEESKIINRQGKTIDVELKYSLIELGDRKLLSIDARDITERKRLEEQLRQAQKMQDLGQLAGGVAHDFNNILSIILSYSELILLDEDEIDEKNRAQLIEIYEAGKRAASLTNQLLAFSRKQPMYMELIEVGEVIQNSLKMLKRLIGADIELITRFDQNLYRIYADKGQIEQVILNLAVNARDAMPNGGKLTIELTNTILDENYTRYYLDIKPGAYLTITVSDTGIGMDQETKAHIFEPFFTTKEVGKGTGLGLSTVHGIVKQFDGHVNVYSEKGYGTTFRIFLPRSEADRKSDTSPDLLPANTKKTGTILLIEDDEKVRQVVSDILLSNGYTVFTANAGEVVEVAEAHGGKIDLLLTDVIMPKINGRQVAERLQAEFPGINVLYMSGYTSDIIEHHLGTNFQILQKPVTPAKLLAKVNEVLNFSRVV